MKVYLVHFPEAPLTFLICCDMLGVLRGNDARRFASRIKRQKTKCKSQPRYGARLGKF